MPGRHLTGRPSIVTLDDAEQLQARVAMALHRGWASSDLAVVETVLEVEDETKPEASIAWIL